MTTNEILEATYRVYYYPENPINPPQDNKLPNMNYLQAINVATSWMKEYPFVEIRDNSIPILSIKETRGVEFVTQGIMHTHFEEHLKIKLALDKVWGEIWSKRLHL
jgi:hypothetical protein